MKSKTKIFWIIILAAFIAVDAYMLFHNLGKGFLVQTDEAWHATNGYEMVKQGNWIINSYRYAADYFNSKPPLCLDLMMVSYKIFGVSNFAARFPSALAGLITIALIVVFLIRDKKTYAAALFPIIFGACSTFFTFHMYRAAEMDAIYNLFFVTAMLSLYMMAEQPNFMYLYGLSFGLAFMCKGPHSALIFVIGLLYIPKCKAAFKSIPRVIISALLAAAIPLAWMAKRYMFDGMELINKLFMGEVAGRVSNASQNMSAPIIDFFTSNSFFVFVATVIAMVIIALVAKRTASDQEKRATTSLKEFAWDNYLFIVWTVVPVVFFAATRSFLSWYTYTAQIALCILAARLAEYCIKEVGKETVISQALTAVAIIAVSLFCIVPTIMYDVNLAGTGGHPVDQFLEDMQQFKDQYGDTYSGVNAYLISEFRLDVANEDHWEPEYVAPAEMYPDLMPVDGTVDNFLSDPDSIIIVDKDRWDEFAGDLSGHVILFDGSYLILSSDMY
ncbi:hypothetical protein D6855_12755 [Butyrivibrio sp. CB08]|uniref:glycosyltransferase family 39 protein n=1 Tax=Butyrivibrio sp. CB08 TaxID=2364879 RepID=UPI000EA9A81C|nr:glycosyltransferase family 39 protein [Butyrivibrio sp. CB08]RKM57913.1 hypothetical protein D6855_12755 [Butyrivibrio sp. CB08]